LLVHTDNLRLLDAFAVAGLLPADDAAQLADAYCTIRHHINHLALQEQPSLASNDVLLEQRTVVAAIWDRFMAAD
jgi:glutamate-ammonia-ligase adenylyltransferase